MKIERPRVRPLLAALGTIAVCALLLRAVAPPDASQSSARRLLAADGQLRWYRGNIHTHTLWSDGDDYPEMVAKWYKDHGYQFLCFTDHNTLLAKERWVDAVMNKGGKTALEKLQQAFPEGWVEERKNDKDRLEIRLKTFDEISARLAAPGEFLLIQGEEISDSFQKRPIHMNASNVRELIPPLHGDSTYEVIQRTTDALHAQRERTRQPMLIHLNHPNFVYGVTAEDLMRVRGENFFEVYNGHPSVNNKGDELHAGTERIWDVINALRLTEFDLPLLYGLAVDDGHNYHTVPGTRAAAPGRGWVQVLACELTPATLIEAMEAGQFYASSGVRLASVLSTDKRLEVEVDAEPDVQYVIEFIGTQRGFDPKGEPILDEGGKPLPVTQRYDPAIGKTLQTATGPRATYEFSAEDLYVRARITSSRQHPDPSEPGEFERAWTQPALGPAGHRPPTE